MADPYVYNDFAALGTSTPALHVAVKRLGSKESPALRGFRHFTVKFVLFPRGYHLYGGSNLLRMWPTSSRKNRTLRNS